MLQTLGIKSRVLPVSGSMKVFHSIRDRIIMFQASGDRQRVSRLSASRNHVSYLWSSEKHVTCLSGSKKHLSLPSVSKEHGEPTSAGKKHPASFRQCQAQDNVSNFDVAFVRRAIFISMVRSVLSESLSRTLWAFSDFRSYG